MARPPSMGASRRSSQVRSSRGSVTRGECCTLGWLLTRDRGDRRRTCSEPDWREIRLDRPAPAGSQSYCASSLLHLVAMILRPNPSTGVPIYLQLMEQVKHSIETGALRPGEQLPGIRPLAEELVINP